MKLRCIQIVISLIATDFVLSTIQTGVSELDNILDSKTGNATGKLLTKVKTRRAEPKKKNRSTSSSSKEGARKTDDTHSGESLSLTSDDEPSSKDNKNKKKSYLPKSSIERHGWRKWHRKCQKCPEEMAMKWRDPRIKWICGAYQRARRSFKSLCMMHYRNCQDGTMFVKISEHRCPNDTENDPLPHGDHFFYDYRAWISGDTSNSDESPADTSQSSEDTF